MAILPPTELMLTTRPLLRIRACRSVWVMAMWPKRLTSNRRRHSPIAKASTGTLTAMAALFTSARCGYRKFKPERSDDAARPAEIARRHHQPAADTGSVARPCSGIDESGPGCNRRHRLSALDTDVPRRTRLHDPGIRDESIR